MAALPLTDGDDDWLQLSQTSWLLKTVAVEVKMLADRGLQSHSSKLAAAFLHQVDEATCGVGGGDASFFGNSVTADLSHRSVLGSSASILPGHDHLTVRSRPKIVLLLDSVCLTVRQLFRRSPIVPLITESTFFGCC